MKCWNERPQNPEVLRTLLLQKNQKLGFANLLSQGLSLTYPFPLSQADFLRGPLHSMEIKLSYERCAGESRLLASYKASTLR